MPLMKDRGHKITLCYKVHQLKKFPPQKYITLSAYWKICPSAPLGK